MPPRMIKPTADAIALAELYVKATHQYDSTPATDKMLRAVLSGRRLAIAVQLAEELTPLLTDAETPFSARLTPIPPRPTADEVDPRETAARMDAAGSAHREPGVGTITTKGATP